MLLFIIPDRKQTSGLCPMKSHPTDPSYRHLLRHLDELRKAQPPSGSIFISNPGIYGRKEAKRLSLKVKVRDRCQGQALIKNYLEEMGSLGSKPSLDLNSHSALKTSYRFSSHNPLKK